MEIIIARNMGLCYGVKHAPNRRKRCGISRRILPRTHFIESAGQIKPRMLAGAKIIGLSGGASTPPEAIEAVLNGIQRAFEQHHQEESRPQ